MGWRRSAAPLRTSAIWPVRREREAKRRRVSWFGGHEVTLDEAKVHAGVTMHDIA